MAYYGPLITPDQVVDLLLAVARTEIARQEHLAELERQKGLSPRTVPDYQVGLLSDEDERQPQDGAPLVLLGDVGTAGPPTEDENRNLEFVWTIAAEVTYIGQGKSARRDAARGVRWYAMAFAQLLLQRTPRNTPVLTRLRLRDLEPLDPGPTQRVARCRLLFEATSGASLAMVGAPPLVLPDFPSPLPFPQAPPDDAYDPTPEWPDVTSAHAATEKEPIT